MTGRAFLVLLAACGPARGPDPALPPAAGVKKAALVVVAPDAATFDTAAGVLAPVGGAVLLRFRFGTDVPWPAAELAARGVRADAPLGGALTADGVAVRWATVADTERLGAAFDRVPGAARWQADGKALWRFGADALAVIARDRAAIVAGGAPSRREQTALAIASGALDVGAAPLDGGIAIEVDGPALVAAAIPQPGPHATRIGIDLGRIRVGVTAAAGLVGIDVELRPAPNTLAAELVAGASGPRMMTPEMPVSLATRLAPERAIELLTELATPAGIDVAEIVQAIGRGPAMLAGDVALAPGVVSVRLADVDTMMAVARLLAPITYDKDHGNGSMSIGGHASTGPGGGIVLRPDLFGVGPTISDPPAKLDPIDDDNGDVPWTLDYKAARKAFEDASNKLDDTLSRRTSAINAAWYRWGQAFGDNVAIQLLATDGVYKGHGEWRPPKGTILASVDAAKAEFDDLGHLDRDAAAAHAAALAARQHVLEVRARDVQAWDNKHK